MKYFIRKIYFAVHMSLYPVYNIIYLILLQLDIMDISVMYTSSLIIIYETALRGHQHNFCLSIVTNIDVKAFDFWDEIWFYKSNDLTSEWTRTSIILEFRCLMREINHINHSIYQISNHFSCCLPPIFRDIL